MRTIKFRGKSINGEWVYGFFSEWNGLAFIDTRLLEEPTRVLQETVGQFTGLHDKHGHEIYEGDIVRHDENSECFVVVYDAPEFCYKDNSFGFRYMVYTSELITVVGNIHDNPELLEKGGHR